MNIRLCRWGILSTAVVGHKNWQAIQLSGNGQVVAVASRESSRSQQFIDDLQKLSPFPNPPVAYGSYQELIDADDVDAIYIPLPTGLRKEWVIRAANAGKHVLCEKPCAVSSTDLAAMIKACEDNNVQFMDGVMFMHSHRLAEMRKVLDDDSSLGELKRIAVQFSFLAPDEFKEANIRTTSDLEPQGVLGDLGWYCLRFILWANRYSKPQSVTGRMLSEIKRPDSPDSVPMEFSGEVLWENGISASFYCSFLTELQQWASISGTKGNVSISDFVLPFFGNQLNFYVNKAAFEMDGCDFRMERFVQQHGVAEHGNSAPNSQETELFRKFGDLVLNESIDEHWPTISMLTQNVLDGCLESARNNSAPVSIN